MLTHTAAINKGQPRPQSWTACFRQPGKIQSAYANYSQCWITTSTLPPLSESWNLHAEAHERMEIYTIF